MANYHISLNKELAKIVDRGMKEGCYANRSEFFRNLVRKYCIEEEFVPTKTNTPEPDCKLI